MILADSSAWIEYDRATGSPVDRRVTALVGGDGKLVVTEPVVMEVDCMIASVAVRYEAVLLARDVDLVRVAEVVGLAVDGG
jgi:predicted nucleic acid-binding protein